MQAMALGRSVRVVCPVLCSSERSSWKGSSQPGGESSPRRGKLNPMHVLAEGEGEGPTEVYKCLNIVVVVFVFITWFSFDELAITTTWCTVADDTIMDS
jgi:hypothetical protein